MLKTLTAIIPARAGSRRLKNKSIAQFGGSNLLAWKIKQLKDVPEITDIVVSSDSDLFLEIAKKEGVKTHKRPPEYCDEKSKSFGEVVAFICKAVEGEHILWAFCTTPLVFPEHYSKAIGLYLQNLDKHDSLISVEPFHRYVWSDKGPLNYELGIKHKPSQELEQLYFFAGGIELAPRKKMIEWNYFHGTNPYKFALPKINCVDIDDEIDLENAKARLNLIKSQIGKRRAS